MAMAGAGIMDGVPPVPPPFAGFGVGAGVAAGGARGGHFRANNETRRFRQRRAGG